MKRLLTLTLAIILILSLAACAKEAADSDNTGTLTSSTGASQSAPSSSEEVSSEEGSSLEGSSSEQSSKNENSSVNENSSENENSSDTTSSDTETPIVHTHVYAPATCTEPQKCECGETKGSPLGGSHTFYNKKCTKCDADIDVTGDLGNVMLMGDSISTFDGHSYNLGQFWYGDVSSNNTDVRRVEQTYWNILMSNMSGKLVYNRSCSGSTVSEAKWSGGVSSKLYNSFNFRLDLVLSDNELQSRANCTPADIDTFIFFAGTNDNNVGDGPNLTMGPKYSDWTSEDLKYFAPAYCRYIDTVKKNFPNAKIVSIVNTKLTKVADTMLAINEHYGVQSITVNGFDMKAPHPTVKGMQQLEETIRKALCE